MPPTAVEIEKTQRTQADRYEDRRSPHQQVPKRQIEIKPEQPSKNKRPQNQQRLEYRDEPGPVFKQELGQIREEFFHGLVGTASLSWNNKWSNQLFADYALLVGRKDSLGDDGTKSFQNQQHVAAK